MHGWAFVAADVTAPALEWAGKNCAANPHLAPLIEVRRSGAGAGGAGAAERVLTHRDALPLSSSEQAEPSIAIDVRVPHREYGSGVF